MGLRLDHVIISVTDLEGAIANYQKLGFNAFYGGKHGDGLTHNGLVIFADGSYLELIALVDPSQREAASFKQLVREAEGYTGYALLSNDIDSDIEMMQQQGIQTNAIRSGSRERGDGAQLRWRMARLGTQMSPFIIQDETEHNLRVPDDAQTTTHENSAQAITNITILAEDFGKVVTRYSALLGTMAATEGDIATFPLDGCTITVRACADTDEQHYAAQFGAVPYELTVRGGTTSQLLDVTQAHGARLQLEAAD